MRERELSRLTSVFQAARPVAIYLGREPRRRR